MLMGRRAPVVAASLTGALCATVAMAQIPGSSKQVEESVSALTAAGPWVAALLTAAWLGWTMREQRRERGELRAVIDVQEKRAGELQIKLVETIEQHSTELLGLAEGTHTALGKMSTAIGRQTDRLEQLCDELRARGRT